MALEASEVLPSARLPVTTRYSFYVLGVLVLIGACSWIDRQLLAIVLQSIKVDLSLSDTQLGLVAGVAFGLFYVAVGLPVACLADRYSRRNIIALATALWSGMTALTGSAGSYTTLFLCRLGVGIGEAGGAAPSQSLVSDYFPVHRRAFAMGVLYSYVPIGYLVSYSLGGWLNDTMGWRNAFVLFGLPGLVLALLVRFTVREPARGASENDTHPRTRREAPSFLATIGYFLRRPALRHLPLAGAAHGIGMFAVAVWLPAFFIRTHHMTSTAVGLRLALIMGVAGILGTLGGGLLVDRWVGKTSDPRWSGWLCAAFLAATIPFTAAVFLVSDATTALLLYFIPTVLNHMILGPVVAAVQNLAGVTRRAMAAAFYLFAVNLVASGLGPMLAGLLSDGLQAHYGADSLRYSLLFLVPTMSAWASVHFFLAGRTMHTDMPVGTMVS
jgi:predicted MFS family arabinose efflux permease